MKFTILVDPSLVIITTHILSETMPQSREDFLGNTLILHFLPQIISPWGGGYKSYNFMSPVPIDATYQIWLRLGQ